MKSECPLCVLFFDNLCNCAKTHFLIGICRWLEFELFFAALQPFLMQIASQACVTQFNSCRNSSASNLPTTCNVTLYFNEPTTNSPKARLMVMRFACLDEIEV